MVEQIAEAIAEQFPDGGHAYFTALDERLIDARVFDAVLRMVPDGVDLIVSGRWGEAFAEWYGADGWPEPREVVVIPGGLRHEGVPYVEMPRLSPGRYAFLDDSYYFGRTADFVRRWVRDSGAQFEGVYVAYDGSPVRALYRYHPS